MADLPDAAATLAGTPAGPGRPPDEADLIAAISRLGVASSVELQQALRRSQPTVSRLLAAAAGRVTALGRGRSVRYSLSQPILGAAGRQPLHWVGEDGGARRWGTLTLVAGQRLHVEGGDGGRWSTQGALPWLLAPLRFEGFLGRLLARRLAPFGFGSDPAQWSLEQQLFAALQTPDAPGALVLGDAAAPPEPAMGDDDYDRLADEVAAGGRIGSSAGGEQPKFTARHRVHGAVLVKYTPPRGTPFGEQWSDLLHAEALALQLLGEHGVPVARARMVLTPRRSHLESRRFDRVGSAGRAHVVPLWAAHDAFVPGPRRHWAATCEVLAEQRRLPREAAAQAAALLAFGRLIGNTDMHFGNLSLAVTPADVAKGRFSLAPVYDMLPMRWRPDPHAGDLGLLPFDPEPADRASAARPLAEAFWDRVAVHRAIGRDFRALAVAMRGRVAKR
ncbi:MAG: HipA domain-containing protein [Aquabacterium sp.]